MHSLQTSLPPLPQAQPGLKVFLLVGSHPHKRSNAAALVGIYGVLMLGMTPEEAYAPVARLEPFTGFRDASCGMPTYQLTVLNVIKGMHRAKEVRLCVRGVCVWGGGMEMGQHGWGEQSESTSKRPEMLVLGPAALGVAAFATWHPP